MDKGMTHKIRRKGVALALLLASMSSAAAANGIETAPVVGTQPTVRAEEIRAAMERVQAKRGLGITSIVLGSTAILVGIVVSASESEDVYNYDTGRYETDVDWAGMAVGLAVGAPLIALGVIGIINAGREGRQLQREKQGLSLVPAPELGLGGMKLAFNF